MAFPGHFLLRVAADDAEADAPALILDPFDGGAELDEAARRAAAVPRHGRGRAVRRVAAARVPAPPAGRADCSTTSSAPTSSCDRSSQAHRVTDLLLSADPTLLSERRDRGLLAYHLDDFPAALSDLEDYVRLNAWTEPGHADEADKDEQAQIREHIKNLRRRVASMN